MDNRSKRGPGRPPLERKEPKREVHLYLPESLAKLLDEKRGTTPLSTYILQVLQKDVEQG